MEEYRNLIVSMIPLPIGLTFIVATGLIGIAELIGLGVITVHLNAQIGLQHMILQSKS